MVDASTIRNAAAVLRRNAARDLIQTLAELADVDPPTLPSLNLPDGPELDARLDRFIAEERRRAELERRCAELREQMFRFPPETEST